MSSLHLYEVRIKKDKFGVGRREGHETSESTMAFCRMLLLNKVREDTKSKLQQFTHLTCTLEHPKSIRSHNDKPQTEQPTKSQRGVYITTALLQNL